MATHGKYHAAAMQAIAAARFLEPIGPSDIARAVGLSPAYASAVFRRHHRRTLTSYLAGLRIAHAQGLLKAEERRTVAEVAAASGFSSMSRFYEAFRAATGRTPTEARAKPRLPPVLSIDAPSSPVVHALWVDDQPLNNLRERRMLAQLGVYADTCRSNDEAMRALDQAGYAMVISDVSRTGKTESGWDFARYVRGRFPGTPFLFYCGFVNLHRRGIARRAGATVICDRPLELMDAASTLKGRRAARRG